MALFSRKITYDRRRLLKAAEAATRKRRWRRAVLLYSQILAAERRNPEIQRRIAPLLARVGRRFDAWESFRAAADTPELAADPKRCATIYARATASLPKNVEAWRSLARACLRCEEPDAALAALLEGRKRFRKKRRNFEAILLLRDALELEPWKPEIVLDLARLLMRSGQSSEALFWLEALDEKVSGATRRQTRALIWRIDPTFGNTWRRWFQTKQVRSNLAASRRRRRA